MVYALKSYNNNRVYKREEEKNVLNILMRRFASDAIAGYPNERKTFLDKSVQNLAVNSIIEGYFPKENIVRQMAIKRVNKMLCVIIGLLISVVVISYYFVLSCEMKLNDLSRQTVILNNENSDLQNQLDRLKSFNNVDKTFQQNNHWKYIQNNIQLTDKLLFQSFQPPKSTIFLFFHESGISAKCR